MEKPKRRMRILDMKVANPKHYLLNQDGPNGMVYLSPRMTIEETGKGNLLCYEAYGGRLFRSDDSAVREAVDKFVDDYETMCRMLDEDPAHEYYEVQNFNDLYMLLGILETHFGDQWGYTNTEDWRVNDMKFDIELLEDLKGTIFEKFHEPILIIEPRPSSYPMECYKEV